MAKKIIGVVGLKKAQISLLNKKYSKAEFIDVNDNNFFQKKILKIDALVVLYEYPVKKNLSKFLTIKHKEFKNLNWVHLTRAGVDECESFMKDYKFKFTAGKKIQGPNVSEHCVSLLLAITRGLFDQYNDNKYSFRPTEIKDKKILIAGLGGIGSDIATKLKNFSSSISSIGHSHKLKKYILKNYNLKQTPKIVKNFDILINTLPLTKETRKIFNKKIFKNMKKKSIFISVSRDQTIDIRDLKTFIRKRKFLGVAIDNTGSFRMKKKIIYDKKNNFLLTDHLAGITTDNSRRIKLVFDNIKSYVYGRKLKYEVSKTKGY